MRSLLILVGLVLPLALAAAQVPVGPGTTVINPPRPMATVEFVQEAGIERWQVTLTGGNFAVDKAYLRISGLSCTQLEEVYRA